MSDPVGWDDPREYKETDREKRRGLLRGPDEDPPSPQILKLALLAAAIIVVIALILYFRARKAPPALRNDLRGAPASLSLCDISTTATSNGQSWVPGATTWKRRLTADKQSS